LNIEVFNFIKAYLRFHFY